MMIMITNGRQYAIAERELKHCVSLRRKLLLRLSSAANKTEALNEIDQLQRQAERLTELMKDYVALLSGRVLPPNLNAVRSLPRDLIRARIALGWSEQEFARQCGVQASQVNRWERNYYASVSLGRILAVAALLTAAQSQRPLNPKLLGRPLKLGADWFDTDFRTLADENRRSKKCNCGK